MVYYDIGHNRDEPMLVDKRFKSKETVDKIWWWDRGIQIADIGKKHYELGVEGKYYCGRYEQNSKGKFISIVSPREKEFYEIPSFIVDDLVSTFGSDITIVRFD
jgi:hypothetical protein